MIEPSGPVLLSCPECKAIGSVYFTLTEGDDGVLEDAGYECWECGAKLEYADGRGSAAELETLTLVLCEGYG